MAQLVDVEIVIDPDSTDEPFIPTCLKCGEPARKKVVNEHGDTIGFVCDDHAEAVYAEQQAEEDAAKEEA